MASPWDRFNSKYERDEKTNCWNWKGYLAVHGYGRFFIGRSPALPFGSVYAHRWSYEQHQSPIPDGLQIDHLCRNRACVNPDHLEAVSKAVNILRGESPQAVNARKTHCIRGHEFTPENTYLHKRGARQCKKCGAASQRRYQARLAA